MFLKSCEKHNDSREYERELADAARYETNKKKLDEAAVADLPILDFGGCDYCESVSTLTTTP